MAVATVGPGTPPAAASLAGVATLAVTGTSGNVALPAAGGNVNVLTLINGGTVACFVALGADNTVIALSTGNGLTSIPVPAGAILTMWTQAAWIAAITASSTTTLRVLMGNGALYS